jgi:hypothetical protein
VAAGTGTYAGPRGHALLLLDEVAAGLDEPIKHGSAGSANLRDELQLTVIWMSMW